MRLLLDAMISAKVGEILRERGIDTAAVDGRPDLEGLPDGEVLAWGRDECRAIVTRNNRHFCELGRRATREGAGHAGLILLPRRGPSMGDLLWLLERLAAEHPGDDDLRDQEVWL